MRCLEILFFKMLTEYSPWKCLCLNFNTFYWLSSLLFIGRVKNLVNSQGEFSPAPDIIIKTSPQRGAEILRCSYHVGGPRARRWGDIIFHSRNPGRRWECCHSLMRYAFSWVRSWMVKTFIPGIPEPWLFYPPPPGFRFRDRPLFRGLERGWRCKDTFISMETTHGRFRALQ